MIIPKIGVGTFRLSGQAVIDSVSRALDVGYRAIDTAQIYGNEAEVGTAIKQSKVSRQELFLTTKIWTGNYAPERMIASLKDSLHKLQTNAVNLTLIHWPAPGLGYSAAELVQSLYQAKSWDSPNILVCPISILPRQKRRLQQLDQTRL